jgi:hypothetical protein
MRLTDPNFPTEEEIKEPQKTEFFQKAPQIEDLE